MRKKDKILLAVFLQAGAFSAFATAVLWLAFGWLPWFLTLITVVCTFVLGFAFASVMVKD